MLAGPCAGVAATISVPGAATARAVAAIFSVIDAVVFGLTTRMRMGLTVARVDGGGPFGWPFSHEAGCQTMPLPASESSTSLTAVVLMSSPRMGRPLADSQSRLMFRCKGFPLRFYGLALFLIIVFRC